MKKAKQYTQAQLLDLPYALDWDQSVRLCKVSKAKKRDCYRNAIRAAGFVTPRPAALYYVEGFTDAGSIPIEHGWLEIDGRVIDPTLPLWAKDTPPRFYITAYKWTVSQYLDLLTDCRQLPIWGRYEYTADFEPMAAAHDEAFSIAFGIDGGHLAYFRHRWLKYGETSTQ